ncbi:MAG: abortive infection family protein [Tissierellia bacterium]|nr:abortive infection family protein [Fermentimonas sp.]MDD4436579.1 abortive infection family protein [Tissierellia bacterium]
MSKKILRAPLSDEIVIAMACLVDDAQVDTREPSHSDIEFQIQRSGLEKADPKKQGRSVGKAKRIRAVLSWALENDIDAGEKLVYYLISTIRGLGGFRSTSVNYVGQEAITNAIQAFKMEGYTLSIDGEFLPTVLENLSNKDIENALYAYVNRAKRGVEDAALLTGTGKDLLEAVSAHVLVNKWGTYPTTVNFPTLLGQAFTALELATSNTPVEQHEPAKRRMERALYELACSINNLRNKEGTGHGRPFVSSLTEDEARVAIESIGTISEYLLTALKKNK